MSLHFDFTMKVSTHKAKLLLYAARSPHIVDSLQGCQNANSANVTNNEHAAQYVVPVRYGTVPYPVPVYDAARFVLLLVSLATDLYGTSSPA